MAYDEALADTIRTLLHAEAGVSEKKMFGRLAFLIDGKMAIAASGQGGVLVRADPAQCDRLVDTAGAELAVMRGRPMTGWLRVDPAHLGGRRQVAKWVTVGATYAWSLPAR